MKYRLLANLGRPENHKLSDELIEVLVATHASSIRIERIVSQGHVSPDDFWYEQEEWEWVMLISGSGAVHFEEDDKVVTLRPGDALLIPPHCRHRVSATHPQHDTVWIAIFWIS
jgi:cupin 2 domain-containing protein